MEFRLLGPLEVRRDGEAIALSAHKPRAMLAMLVLEAGRVVSVHRLIEELWDTEPPGSAASNLRTYASHLRRVIFTGSTQRLVSTGNGYRLEMAGDVVDLATFDRHCASAKELVASGKPDQALSAYEHALALWRGRPLAELPSGPVLSAAATAWEERYTAVVEDCFGLRLDAAGHTAGYGELIADLHRHLAGRPLRERPWRQLIVALYRVGDPGGALRAFDRARAVLREELGLDPGPALHRLQQAVLRRDPELDDPIDGRRQLDFWL